MKNKFMIQKIAHYTILKINFKLIGKNYMKNLVIFLSCVFTLSACKIFKTNKVQVANTHSHQSNPQPTIISYESAKANDLIGLARNYTGVPYKSGGTSDNGMDCSGLIYTVCQSAGLAIPRISYQQAEVGDDVDIEQIQKGDLVFFKTSKSSSRISHVGLVTDVALPQTVTFIHASSSKGVIEDNLFSNYWKKAFAKATRPFVF
jgi:probable lipoprotein NlpC